MIADHAVLLKRCVGGTRPTYLCVNLEMTVELKRLALCPMRCVTSFLQDLLMQFFKVLWRNGIGLSD